MDKDKTLSAAAGGTDSIDRTSLPLPESKFGGVVGKTYLESTADWPKVPTPPAGAPNVLVILLDDVGFGQTSTFGGPVQTPALEKLEIGRASCRERVCRYV